MEPTHGTSENVPGICAFRHLHSLSPGKEEGLTTTARAGQLQSAIYQQHTGSARANSSPNCYTTLDAASTLSTQPEAEAGR